MALNRPDLNLLHVFDTIYREGSLTRAAKALHLTQPAISHSLARLRDHFNDPLFTRQGNQMVPTPLARRFLESMRPGLNQIQSAVNQFHAFDPASQRKTYALGLRDVLESTFLPQLISKLAPYPDMEVQSQRVARRDMETQLAAGKLDFAIDVLLPVSNQTSHELLRQDRLVVLARKGHPVIARGLDMASYLEARHILVSSRAEGPGIEDFELSRHGAQRTIRLRCQHYYAACRVVESSDLLLTMPETYARIIAQNTDIEVLAPPVEMPSIDVHLYWHKAYEQEPALVWFRDLLRNLQKAQ
ncbi:MAG TPA: LysR family transcriptional regulator [Marinobacter hydrocarbonoclasticus]|uniref:DNA-binding transcriptional LysR family regulator n=1 Tax=Marinobacter nauticus TaxID=2743 RepID=A0A368V1R1_MARNT|nr:MULTISPECIES: LysR family transcriptional regulator [Marinobacter]MBH91739.1 LysR family transcriptional regulator [Marinobacter sp.]MED5468479.1 LysR family transcriptional regulator [Pseudomonadota bacterium]KAE8544694.1 Transcriptional regulator, LysR family [Marinobacter nauticus]MBU40933.1 LysR family transcriptional regulator [Marinobacter sp.]MBY5938365.1 LysR family transcriptional regulator [Marinobacter nauticus]|tara:strand:+ start:553 stop:1455 length:903 start_codon:yes stop_codon:yes gene_type:complete